MESKGMKPHKDNNISFSGYTRCDQGSTDKFFQIISLQNPFLNFTNENSTDFQHLLSWVSSHSLYFMLQGIRIEAEASAMAQ